MGTIVLFILAVLTSSQGFHISLPEIECEYSRSDLRKGRIVEVILNIDRAKCIAKCFFSAPSCSHVALSSERKECYLLNSKGSEVIDSKEHTAIFGDISCQAVGTPGRHILKRSGKPAELSRYKIDGVCCGEKGHKEFNGTKITTGYLEGLSLELCFASCHEKGCRYIRYVPGNKTCQLFLVDQAVQCEGEESNHEDQAIRSYSPEVDIYCNVVCHEGSSLPPDICMENKTTTEGPNVTESTSTTTNFTQEPNVTESTSTTTNFTQEPNVTESTSTTTNFTQEPNVTESTSTTTNFTQEPNVTESTSTTTNFTQEPNVTESTSTTTNFTQEPNVTESTSTTTNFTQEPNVTDAASTTTNFTQEPNVTDATSTTTNFTQEPNVTDATSTTTNFTQEPNVTESTSTTTNFTQEPNVTESTSTTTNFTQEPNITEATSSTTNFTQEPNVTDATSTTTNFTQEPNVTDATSTTTNFTQEPNVTESTSTTTNFTQEPNVTESTSTTTNFTQEPNVTESTSTTTNFTHEPNVTESTSTTTNFTQEPNVTESTSPTTIFTQEPNVTESTTQNSQPTTEPPPCDQSCIDPCNMKVQTKDWSSLTTTVCRHGKCTSKYIGNNQYTFRCDCFSSTDIPPFCTPACKTTTSDTMRTTSTPTEMPTTTTVKAQERFKQARPKMTPPTSRMTTTTNFPAKGEGVVLIGGGSYGDSTKSSMEFYSISHHRGTELDLQLKQGRKEHVGGKVALDTILVVGGRVAPDPSKPTATSEYIDLKHKTTKPGPNLNTARALAAAAFKFLTEPVFHYGWICGGIDEENKTLNSCEYYINGTFQPFKSMLVERKGLALTYYRFDGTVSYLLAMGGTNHNGEKLKSVERNDGLLTNGYFKHFDWKQAGNMNYARESFAADILDGHTYVAGGGSRYVERYDGTNDKWHVVGNKMKQDRYGLAFVAVTGTLYALGGQQPPISVSSVEKYRVNGSTSEWEMEREALLSARSYHVGIHVSL